MARTTRRNSGVKLPGLRKLREERGVTRAALARALEMDEIFLYRLETGRNGAGAQSLVELADYFQVPVSRLRQEDEKIYAR